MRVKIRNVLSDEQGVTGSAIRGSMFGVMDHNAVLEFTSEGINFQGLYKYVDDLTLEETINKEVEYLCETAEKKQTLSLIHI